MASEWSKIIFSARFYKKGINQNNQRFCHLFIQPYCVLYPLRLMDDMALSQSASYCNEAKLIAMLFSPLELQYIVIGRVLKSQIKASKIHFF